MYKLELHTLTILFTLLHVHKSTRTKQTVNLGNQLHVVFIFIDFRNIVLTIVILWLIIDFGYIYASTTVHSKLKVDVFV